MDTDDSYESISEASHETDTEPSSSNSMTSVNRDSDEVRELYASTFSGPVPSDNTVSSLTVKVKEQSLEIQRLTEERTKLLEQITQVCERLERKEAELLEFMEPCKEKVDEARKLIALFSSLLNGSNDVKSLKNDVAISNAMIQQPVCGQKDQDVPATTDEESAMGPLDQYGRVLLQELTALVASANQKRKSDQLNGLSKAPSLQVNPNNHRSRIAAKLNPGLMCLPPLETQSQTDSPEYVVSRLPHLFWTPDHVQYWLTEYVCLPGGCLEAARRLQLDGNKLVSMTGDKEYKALCLTDPGLRRKFQLALDDLRVHGSPGLSHIPGPSHLRPSWVCDVWLSKYLGLAQLVPLFAVRRIDGRLLASLAVYKAIKRPVSRHWSHRQSRMKQLNPLRDSLDESIASRSGGFNSVPGTPQTSSNGALGNDPLASRVELSDGGSWSGANRKEMYRILLGLSGRREASSGMASVSGGGASGAELSQTAKAMLGKYEIRSLRTGIELLRLFNFDIERLEKAQQDCENTDTNLLVWTNQRVAKWLKSLKLTAFTQGIQGSGLHGAYMVLDPKFDANQLVKQLRLPSSVVDESRLEAHLQSLLEPARSGFFPRRSRSRPKHLDLMQRSVTLTNGPSSNPSTHGANVTTNITHYPINLNASSPTPLTSNGSNPIMHQSASPKKWKLGLSMNGREQKSTPMDSPSKKSISSDNSSNALSINEGKENEQVGKERSNTLVRQTSNSAIGSVVDAPTVGKCGLVQPSISSTTSGVKYTPNRGGVPACEAPLIDPFGQSFRSSRRRIMLPIPTSHVLSPTGIRITPPRDVPSSSKTSQSIIENNESVCLTSDESVANKISPPPPSPP